MNTFDNYYTSILNEMARSGLITTRVTIPKKGGKTETLTRASRVGGGLDPTKYQIAINYIENFNYSKLSRKLKSGDDDLIDATNILNVLKGIPESVYDSSKKRSIIEKLIEATNTPYHQFNQVKDLTIDQFIRTNREAVDKDKRKLPLKQRKNIISNIKKWNHYYLNLAELLAKLDMVDSGKLPENWHELSSVAQKNKLKVPATAYYKDRSGLRPSIDVSTGSFKSSITREETAESRDKALIFYFDSNGNPWKTSLVMDATDPTYQQYHTWKERAMHVPVKKPFQKGSRQMSIPVIDGMSVEELSKLDPQKRISVIKSGTIKVITYARKYGSEPPPSGFIKSNGSPNTSNEPAELRNKTVNQIKTIVNHNAAFDAFKKKYPFKILQEIDSIKGTDFHKRIYRNIPTEFLV